MPDIWLFSEIVKEFYIIVKKENVTHGHGDFSEGYNVVPYDDKCEQIYPIFKTEISAREYYYKKLKERLENNPYIDKKTINARMSTLGKPEILKLSII